MVQFFIMRELLERKRLEPCPYERIVLNTSSGYHFMKIQLIFQEVQLRLNAAQFKQVIILALKELHGEIGAALLLDVLTFDEQTLTAIIRICSRGLVKLWSALTLLGNYQNQSCAFRVIQTSPFLLALAGNSRELVLD
ncbi:ribonuclease P protein subunit p14 isoform X1 [Lissotriton helveticus]